MNDKKPYDLFIECRCCSIENMITDYVPSMPIFCNQCRERLIDDDLTETHLEYVCQACDMKLVLSQAKEVKLGESACSCGSTDVLKTGKTTLPGEVLKAGGLIDSSEGDGEILEDADWMRPGGSESFDDDYEDMFNQDPSQN
jgi:hypothetical protein